MTNKAGNKFKTQFDKKYPWYDQSYFFKLIHDWAINAASKHKVEGHCVSSDRTSRELYTLAELAKRLSDEEIFINNALNNLFIGRKIKTHLHVCDRKDEKTKIYHTYEDNGSICPDDIAHKKTKIINKREERQRKETLEALTSLMNRKALGWWD